LGASLVGFVPGGDIAKAAVKSATKATKAAAKAGADVVDNVGNVVKGSAAATADGLSGAQRGKGECAERAADERFERKPRAKTYEHAEQPA